MAGEEKLFIEGKIVAAVKRLLSGRVNELLGEMPFRIPSIEFGSNNAGCVTAPAVSLFQYERSEKERLICLNVYALRITFPVPERKESELYCYAYSAAVEKAIQENPTLGGIVSNLVITGKKYSAPTKPHCGEDWELTMSFHITIEENA